VRAASAGNVNITTPGTAVFDGVTLTNGDTILLKDQTLPEQNGVYVFNGSGTAMTRFSGLDTSGEAVTGLLVTVAEGTAAASTIWMLTTPQPITLGTTGLVFSLAGNVGFVATEVTVDFGAIPTYAKQFSVSIQGLTVGQRVTCAASGYTPVGVDFDEHEFGVLVWVGKVTAPDTLLLLGTSTSAIRGQRIVQVTSKFTTPQMFVQAGTSVTPDYILQANNLI
jgi:hypothetical protein